MTEQEQYLQEKAEYEEYMREKAAYESEKSAFMSAPKTSNEAHPDLEIKDRLLIKNLSNSPEAAIGYLQNKYPEHEFMSTGSEVYMKKKGAPTFQPIDPEGVTSLKEGLLDIGDVATDVGSSLLQGAATAAGGLAGAVGGAPGALAGGALAGSASGAALEAARQKAGQLAGLPQEVSGEDVATTAAIGAASPLLFGTGAKALTPLAQEAQKGLAANIGSFATRKAYPKVAEVLSGIPSQTTQNYMELAPKLKALEQEGITDYASEAHGKLVDSLAGFKTEVGKKLEKSIDEAGEYVSVDPIKKPFQELIEAFEKKGAPNEATKNQLAQVKSTYDELFSYKTPEGNTVKPKKMSASQAFSMQDQLNDLAETYKLNQAPGSRFSASATKADKQLMETARKSSRAVNDELSRVTKGLSTEAKQEYADLSKIQKHLRPFFKDEQSTLSTLSNLSSKNRQPLYETLTHLKKQYGIDLTEEAKLLEVRSRFSKPSLDAMSIGGTTSTSRTIPLATAGGGIGSYLGYTAGGIPGGFIGTAVGAKLGSMAGSPAAIRAGADVMRGAEKVGRKITPPASALPLIYRLQKSNE